jgi:hypothetical protein
MTSRPRTLEGAADAAAGLVPGLDCEAMPFTVNVKLTDETVQGPTVSRAEAEGDMEKIRKAIDAYVDDRETEAKALLPSWLYVSDVGLILAANISGAGHD